MRYVNAMMSNVLATSISEVGHIWIGNNTNNSYCYIKSANYILEINNNKWELNAIIIIITIITNIIIDR